MRLYESCIMFIVYFLQSYEYMRIYLHVCLTILTS